MTNEILQSTKPEQKQVPFGMRLKSAREGLGLERKDAASQLRLSEKVILMMEKDRYPIDMPVTFIRGYLRSYAKLLQIPEYEIKKAIEPIKPKPMFNEAASSPAVKLTIPVTNSNHFMHLFTYLVIFTLIGLIAVWWYTRTTSLKPRTLSTSNQLPASIDSLHEHTTNAENLPLLNQSPNKEPLLENKTELPASSAQTPMVNNNNQTQTTTPNLEKNKKTSSSNKKNPPAVKIEDDEDELEINDTYAE